MMMVLTFYLIWLCSHHYLFNYLCKNYFSEMPIYEIIPFNKYQWIGQKLETVIYDCFAEYFLLFVFIVSNKWYGLQTIFFRGEQGIHFDFYIVSRSVTGSVCWPWLSFSVPHQLICPIFPSSIVFKIRWLLPLIE